MSNFSNYNVVRLNTDLFPITQFEQEKYDEHDIIPEPVEVSSRDDLIENVKEADAVMVVSESLPTEVVEAMHRCRVICRIGAGTDKIDVATATARGIVVANVPDFCVEEQADHAFALLLAVARNLRQMHDLMLAGRYLDAQLQSKRLRRLPGRTLGLVGFGRSAKAMGRRVRHPGTGQPSPPAVCGHGRPGAERKPGIAGSTVGGVRHRFAPPTTE